MRIVLIPIILILLWVLSHNIKKSKSTFKESVSSYLAHEDEANSTRKKDISNLPYIEVPVQSFPFDITLNDAKKQLQIAEYKKEILSLAEKRLLNLIGISNTDLKKAYGPANLELLSIYDQNYSRYIRTLHLLAECIYEEYPDKAVAVLEYCVSLGTDISGTYYLLGQYYLNHNDAEHFTALYDKIPDKNSISGKVILNKLSNLQNPDSVL
ncbi:MAG: hypothetical protein HFJ06_09200 [Lachnospiraceae bacterium]|nr:hypothetical protein [Lachnospiraceae bacterium]